MEFNVQIVDDLKSSEALWVTNIKLTPEKISTRLCERRGDSMPYDYLKDLASKELANFLISKLSYRRIQNDAVYDMYYHEFSINNCKEMERDVLNQTIDSYKALVNTLDTKLNNYRSASLWERIKMVFKGPQW